MRRPFWKTCSCLALAAVLALSCAGCDTSGETSTPTDQTGSVPEATGSDPSDLTPEAGMPLVDEPITLSLWMPLTANLTAVMTDLNENEVMQELQRRTNVEIEFIHPPVGDASTNLNLLITSGRLPDMIQIRTVQEYYPRGGDYGIANGIFTKLNDLVEQYAPNFSKILNDNPEIKKEVVTDEGNIWGMPMIETEVQPAWNGFAVRQDWLDDLYISTPVTYDDWHDMLVKFRDEKGAKSPLLMNYSGTFGSSDMISGFGVGDEFYVENGVVKYGPIEPGWLEYVTMMNQWYSEGLIDQSFFTRDSSSLDQMKATGQTGVWHENNMNLSIFTDVLREGDSDASIVAIPSPVKAEGQVNHLRQSNSYNREMYLTITPQCKNPEIAVRWIDYLYSDEGSFLANWGLPASHEYANGHYQFSSRITEDPSGLPAFQAQSKYALHEFSYVRDWMKDYYLSPQNVIDSMEIWNTAQDDWVMPTVSLNEQVSDVYQKVYPDVSAMVFEYRVQFINGRKPLSEYDAMVSALKGIGIDDLVAAYQAAYDRYMAR